MRIGIDCRLAGQAHAGIGRYVTKLAQEVCRANSGQEWVLFVRNQQQGNELAVKHFKNVSLVIAPYRHYSLAEQIFLPQLFTRANLDLLHVPHFNLPLLYQGKVIVTIHDLLWHQHRGKGVTTLSPLVYWLKYGFYKIVVKNAISRAETILVPSKTIARELTKFYPRLNLRPKVVYEGVSWNGKQARKPDQLKFANYLLYVGSLYPHKNWRLLIEALKERTQLKLVVVSPRSAFTQELIRLVKEAKLNQQIQLMINLDDDRLLWLYQHAQALVQPSQSEGFGLTGLEAMAVGTAVLASDIPVFHEIYGHLAHYFSPRSVSQFLQTVELNKQKPREKAKLQAWAKQYSWQSFAKNVFAEYQLCLTQNSKQK